MRGFFVVRGGCRDPVGGWSFTVDQGGFSSPCLGVGVTGPGRSATIASIVSAHQRIIDEATLTVASIDEVSRDGLLAVLREFHFARITGLVSPEEVDRSRQLMAARFNPDDDRPTTGEHHTEVKDNFQKLSIGRARHGGIDRPRFMRCFYLPMWAEDIFGLREIFRKVARVRNILGNRALDFAVDREEDGMWTASRVHHFPHGGGFMVAHRDTVLPQVYKDGGLGEFFQPLILLSQKGEDFQIGGGFVDLRGERILYEDHAGKGDIVIYDTSTDHGVEDIDPDRPFRQDSLAGRMSGLVTLFKCL